MEFMHINLLAVLVAAIASMIVGAVWYSPLLFAKKWMRLVGKTQKDLKNTNMGKSYGGMFVGSLISAFIMAVFINFSGASTVVQGMLVGFLAWLGFFATADMGDFIFSGRPRDLYFIVDGHILASFLVMSAILTAWK